MCFLTSRHMPSGVKILRSGTCGMIQMCEAWFLYCGKVQIPLSRGATMTNTKIDLYTVKIERITVVSCLERSLWCPCRLLERFLVETKGRNGADVKTLFICLHFQAIKQVVNKIYGSVCFEYLSVWIRHGVKRHSSIVFMSS